MIELSTKDKEITNAYIHKYGGGLVKIGIDQILRPWQQNKKLLYRLLGRNLTYSWELDNQATKTLILNQIQRTMLDYTYNSPINNLNDVLRSINDHKNNKDTFQVSAEEILNNRLDHDLTIVIKEKTFVFKKGERLIRNFQKVCNYLKDNYPEKLEENDFPPHRIDSDIDRLTKVVEAGNKKEVITLSIMPMDFLTMSDNEERWSSCMNLRDRGCYCNGAYEMMTSPNVIIAYTKSKHNKITVRKEEKWNSKTWRSLFIVDRRFILSGKAYPRTSNILTTAVIDKIQELAKNNLNWDDFDQTNSIYTYYSCGQNLKIISHDMYNDYKANADMSFLIKYSTHFDKSKKIIVNYSGPIYCLTCGRKLNTNTVHSPDSYICTYCTSKQSPIKCSICKHLFYNDSQVDYLDDDIEFKSPIHKNCFQDYVIKNISDEKQIVRDPTTAAVLLFSGNSSLYWWSKPYALFISNDDLNILKTTPQWHEFAPSTNEYVIQDYNLFEYKGLIHDYSTFHRFIETTIKEAA